MGRGGRMLAQGWHLVGSKLRPRQPLDHVRYRASLAIGKVKAPLVGIPSSLALAGRCSHGAEFAVLE